MRSYPNYHLYVARNESGAVGTFALLIMDNLGHLGACTGVVEDVARPSGHARPGRRQGDDGIRQGAMPEKWLLQAEPCLLT